MACRYRLKRFRPARDALCKSLSILFIHVPSLLLTRSGALALGLGYYAQHILLSSPEARVTLSATGISSSSSSNCSVFDGNRIHDERKDIEGLSQSWPMAETLGAEAVATRGIAFGLNVERRSSSVICDGGDKTGDGSENRQGTTQRSQFSARSAVAHSFPRQRQTLAFVTATTTNDDGTGENIRPSKGGDVGGVLDPRTCSYPQSPTPPLTPLTPAPLQTPRDVLEGSPDIYIPNAGKVPASCTAGEANNANTPSQLQHDTRQQHFSRRHSEQQPQTPSLPLLNALQLLMPKDGSKELPIVVKSSSKVKLAPPAQSAAPSDFNPGDQQRHRIQEQRDDTRFNHGSPYRARAGWYVDGTPHRARASSCVHGTPHRAKDGSPVDRRRSDSATRSPDTASGGTKADSGGTGNTKRGSVHFELDDEMALQRHEGLVSAKKRTNRQGLSTRVRGWVGVTS